MNGVFQVIGKAGADGTSPTLFGFAVVLGLAAGWVLEHLRVAGEIKKLKAETRKLSVEAIKLESDILIRLQEKRKAHSISCDQCSSHLDKLISLITQKETHSEIRTVREDFCRELTLNLLDDYGSLVEWNITRLKASDESVIEYITNDVCSELKRYGKWLEVLNLPIFLEGFNQEPLRIEERTLRSFRQIPNYIKDKESPENLANIKTKLDEACLSITGKPDAS